MKKFLISILFCTILAGCTGENVQQPMIAMKVVDEGTADCKFEYYGPGWHRYALSSEVYCNSAFHSAISPDGKFLVYTDFPRLLLFNAESGQESELMTVLDSASGVDFFWAPDGNRVAVAVVNQNDESYTDTRGTRLFILEVGGDGQLVDKQIYPLKIRYECHDAGCNVYEEDFYFEDNDTIIYRTWESETPYEDAGNDEMLRSLDLE